MIHLVDGIDLIDSMHSRSCQRTSHSAISLGLSEEFGRHGYKLCAGTRHTILRGFETKGHPRSSELRAGKGCRRMYHTTARGRKELEAAKEKRCELFGEPLDVT